MAKKNSKNLQKVQDMLDGSFSGHKTQVGWTPNSNGKREIGDVWEDSEGVKWEQKNGYISKVSNRPPRGFDKCSDCDKLIMGKLDRDTHARMQRCYYCQIDFEADLKTHGKWQAWVKEQEIARWEKILGELEIEDKELDGKKIFDESVANALANHNLDITIKKNKG